MNQISSLVTLLRDGTANPSALVKQSITAIATVVAALTVVLVTGVNFSNEFVAWSGVVVVLLATALSAVMTWNPSIVRFALAVPLIDLVGLGLFRAGTGGIESYFSSLILLPVVWIAVSEGRRYVLLAGAAASLALLVPYLLDAVMPIQPTEWLRAVIAPTTYMLGALIINDLASRGRRQAGAMAQLAEDKEVMLQRTVEYAAQLQESEKKFRAFDRMFRGVWAAVTEQSVIGTDITGLIDAWNPGATKILGPSADDTQDKRHIFDFHVDQELEDYARELNYPPGETVLNPGFSALVESARLGIAESREWSYRRDDGTIVPVQLSVTKRLNDSGDTVGYLFVASDVTQAREVARLKDEFVGLISHELRTPLSSILGYLELMRDDEDDPLSPEHLQYLGVAERNAHRLLRLVGDLLFTAQVESGRFPLDSRELVLDGIISASVESARPVAEAAGITLVELLPGASAGVNGDPVRLGQAVDNLISNAIKFTPRGGTVTVALTILGADLRVTVRDTGMGIAESELDQLFSRFFRATTATRNAVPGVGLGLTITKAIVDAHGGSMSVESEEGVGTCFSLTLPATSIAPVTAIAS